MSTGRGLKLEQTGIELSRAFYYEVGKPAFAERFPEYLPRMAVGLVGEGSECFGFDDLISTDHDYGPSFCIWLTGSDFSEIGPEMAQLYRTLPKDFMGSRYNLQIPQAANRRGVLNTEAFYQTFLGPKGVPQTLLDWFRVPDAYLAVATNGCVFEDPLGEFSAIRRQLLAYYPEDVRRKKIAGRLLVMAQTGQVNYGRMMQRGDTVSASLALHQFMESALHVAYLLNKKYAPYYKWQWRGLGEADRAAEIPQLLQRISLQGLAPQLWEDMPAGPGQGALNTKDAIVNDIEAVCAVVIQELARQGISDHPSDFLQGHAFTTMEGIRDAEIRALPVLAY